MKLKQAPSGPGIAERLSGWLGRRRRLARAGLQLALLGLAFGAGMLAYRQQLHRLVRSVLEANVLLVPHWVEGMLSRPPQLLIDIDYENYLILEQQRQEALRQGFLVVGAEDFVPAEVRLDGQSIPVKIRLKGDHIDHLEGDRWSFRIQTRGDATLLGMKQLSLHHPRTRSYAYEWLYQRALAREDVVALRYRFVEVTVNGRHLGVYALEEHFEKRLVEHNRRREGPILRFDESLFWQEQVANAPFEGQGRQWNGDGSYFASAVDGFQTGALAADPALAEPYALAAGLLDGFRRGELPASQVFDVERTARFFAVSDLMGAEHGTRWHNLRFYFNPVTSRLEPIGFDGFETSGWTGWQDSGLPFPATTLSGVHLLDAEAWGHNARLFADPALFAAYYRALERVSQDAWLDALFAEVEPELEDALAVLYRDFPYYRFSKDLLYQNAAFVRAALHPQAPLRAFVGSLETPGPTSTSAPSLTLEVGNIQNIPLRVLGVSRAGTRLTEYGESVLLAGRHGTAAVDYRRLSLPLAAGERLDPAALAELRVDYALLGSREIAQLPVSPLPREDAALLAAARARSEPNLADFDLLVVDEAEHRIDIQPGSWRLERNLVLPAGYEVTAQGRVALDLVNGAAIVSRSPLRFEGSPEAPIRIESSDGTGQGLAVIEPGAPSTLSDVVFHNLAPPEQPGWALTGAVTFYGASVTLNRVRFEQARAEDALNLVRIDFDLRGCSFSDSASDALDIDFGRGSLVDSRFARLGNDAIDISGSQLRLSGIDIDGFGDKGLSAGEDSRMEGEDLRIADGEIGVASKDRSVVRLKGLELEDLHLGLTAFQKKPEFGPASLAVEGSSSVAGGAAVPWLLEAGSSLSLEGQAQRPNAEALESIFYGVKYGKASR